MAQNDSFRLDIKIAKTQHSLYASRKLKFHCVLSCVQSRIDSGIRVKYLKHIWSNVTKEILCIKDFMFLRLNKDIKCTFETNACRINKKIHHNHVRYPK